MKRLCRAIVWDVIVLGGNRKGGKLFGGNYVNSIYLGSIIQGQLSGWQLCGYNHQWWITLRGNSLTPIAQKLIIWGKDDYREGNIFEGNYLKPNYPRGGRGQFSGSNYLGLNCPALIIVYREISVVSWNLLNDPKHRVSFYKKNDLLWRDSPTCRWFSCYYRKIVHLQGKSLKCISGQNIKMI